MKDQHKKTLPTEIIFWGATGQAIVNREIAKLTGYNLIALFDDTPNLKSPFDDVSIYEGWKGFEVWKKSRQHISDVGFSIAIGNPHGKVRIKLQEELIKQGLVPISLIHPSAIIPIGTILGDGVQIMAGAVIQPNVTIGNQCIINTKASVDHECVLEDGVEIGPGATLCGNITVRKHAWVCAGATVLPRINIGVNSIIGAGAMVNRNVDSNTVVTGIPAKKLRDC